MSARVAIGAFTAALLVAGGVAVAGRTTSASDSAPAPAGESAPVAQARQADDHVWSQDPSSKCRFVAPRSLPAGPTYWTGDCPGGKASGLGMLRRRDGNQSGEVFFGELRDGVPSMGVIDTRRNDVGGLIAGPFANGDIGPTEGKWQDSADAFDIAAKAARAVSARFSAENNGASARFYEAQAVMLEEQVE